MIITIAIDTDDNKDGLKTLEEFVSALKGNKDKMLACAKDFKTLANVYEAARRRTACENVRWETDLSDLPFPVKKRRGRKPKNFKQEA